MIDQLLTIYHKYVDTQNLKCIEKKNYITANKSNKDLNTQNNESLLSFDKRVKSVEIRFAALVTEKNILHQTAKEILNLFQQIGDPNVLKKMTMGRKKC